MWECLLRSKGQSSERGVALFKCNRQQLRNEDDVPSRGSSKKSGRTLLYSSSGSGRADSEAAVEERHSTN